MTNGQHDELRADIEWALHNVHYRNRRLLEGEAQTLAGRVADTLRAKYRVARKPLCEKATSDAARTEASCSVILATD
jgi:hypothetical protein